MMSRSSATAAVVLTTATVIIPAAASPTATALPSCTSDSIALSTGAPGSPGDSTQVHFDVIATNISAEPCVLQGYPGAAAASRLTFLADPNGWVPETIAVTLPNTTRRLETPWIAGGVPVARQDGATHPGTYIGPLQPSD